MAIHSEAIKKAASKLQDANKIIVLSGAGMSTAAGIPDFRSPNGLYGTSEMLIDRFTYPPNTRRDATTQKAMLANDVKSALYWDFFQCNPLPYHEMRRGMIIGLGENQWKPTIGHAFPEILNRRNKLLVLASQNIDGLDHKIVSDKKKLHNPHGLMSWLVSELDTKRPLCTSVDDPIYQKYVALVKSQVKDIYADRSKRQGRSSHLWPAPETSQPIMLKDFGDVLPQSFDKLKQKEIDRNVYSVKPGSVLFDKELWFINAAGEEYNVFGEVQNCDMMLVMGTSLSGLTIDQCAYSAGKSGKPLLVFDMTDAPVQSCKRERAWEESRDTLLQGSLDSNILELLSCLGWFDDIFGFVDQLCLSSLQILKEQVQKRTDSGMHLPMVEAAITAEVERERQFYQGE